MEPVDASKPIPGAARLLGYAGVLPFAAMVLDRMVGAPLSPDFALKIFLFYSAAILSFLGGIRWGSITRSEHGLARELIISVMPSLWAVVCLLLADPAASVWALLAGFALMGLADVALYGVVMSLLGRADLAVTTDLTFHFLRVFDDTVEAAELIQPLRRRFP